MMDSTSPYTDLMIRFIIGEEGRAYYVLRDKLVAALPMKDLASKGVWYIGERCTTETFELFAHYLDGNKLAPIATNNELKTKNLTGKYISLYHFARFLDFRNLENHIMDVLRADPTGRDVLITPPFVKKTYANTNARAHLRHYTVDSFLFKSLDWKMDDLDDELMRHCETGNTRFIAECFRKKSKLKKPIRDTNRKTVKCIHHHHHSRKRCSGGL